jgi:hypothetical protein
LARPIIAQCRREIEAGWQHVEAARNVLRGSLWLVTRWRDNRGTWEHDVALVPKPEVFIPADDVIKAARQRSRAGGLRMSA